MFLGLVLLPELQHIVLQHTSLKSEYCKPWNKKIQFSNCLHSRIVLQFRFASNKAFMYQRNTKSVLNFGLGDYCVYQRYKGSGSSLVDVCHLLYALLSCLRTIFYLLHKDVSISMVEIGD